MPDLSDLFELGFVVGIGFVSSLATGLTVASAFCRKLPTYRLLFSSFIVAVVTWAITSSLIAPLLLLLRDSWRNRWGEIYENGSENGLALTGFMGIASLLLTIVCLLLWQMRDHGIKRWAVGGAVIPWGIVSLLGLIANVYFLKTDTFDRMVPEFFTACVAASMSMGIIVGSCAGGMIYHQTRYLRN